MIKFDFSGKIILVTGGTQGIGLSIAQKFLDAGAIVHITGTRAAAGDYEDDLSSFTYHRLRMDDPEERAAFVEGFGPLDILISNAGQSRDDEYDMPGFRNTLEVNLTGPAELCYLFHPVLKERKGSIVIVGSSACFIALRAFPSYTASKAGILGFTRAVADQWSRDGIRVNLVHPDAVFDTALWSPELLATRAEHYGMSVDEYKRRNLLKAEVRSADVAVMVRAMADDTFRCTTGAQVPVDGGNERVI